MYALYEDRQREPFKVCHYTIALARQVIEVCLVAMAVTLYFSNTQQFPRLSNNNRRSYRRTTVIQLKYSNTRYVLMNR